HAEIEAACDVNERAILNLHWFGLVLTGNFLAWKQDPGAGYRFWPKTGVPGRRTEESGMPLSTNADLARERVGTRTGGGGEGLHPPCVVQAVERRRPKGRRPFDRLCYFVNYFVGAVAFVQVIANSLFVAILLLN